MNTLGLLLADLWADRARGLLSLLTLVLMSMGALLLSGFAESVRLFGAPDAARRELVIVERGVLDPMNSQVPEDILAAVQAQAGAQASRISPCQFRHMRIAGQIVQLRACPPADWQPVHHLELAQGGWPQAGQVAISDGAALATGWQVGDSLQIYGSAFTIAGRVRASGTKFSTVWMRLEDAQQLFDSAAGYQLVLVQAAPGADVEALRAALEASPALAGHYDVLYLDALFSRYTDVVLGLLGVSQGLALAAVTLIVLGSYQATRLSLEERARALAILRVVGFSAGQLHGLLQLRSLSLVSAAFGLGAVLAAGLLAWANRITPLQLQSVQLAVTLTLPGLLVGGLLSLACGALGAWLSARRMLAQPVAALLRGDEHFAGGFPWSASRGISLVNATPERPLFQPPKYDFYGGLPQKFTFAAPPLLNRLGAVALVALRELLSRWRLGLACLLLAAVPVGLTLSMRMFLGGMQQEYQHLSAGLLVVQKSDSMGEIYGSRLKPQVAGQLNALGYAQAIPAIQDVAGTSINDAVLLRGVDLAHYAALDDFEILTGEALHPGSPPRAALLGYRLAEARRLAVGQAIRLRGRDFTVSGIFKTGTYLDNQAWIALADAQALLNYGEDVSVYVIPAGGPLRAGDSLPGGLVVAQRGEMIRQIGQEYLSIINFMNWVVKVLGAATAAMLANILWRLAWQQRRQLSILECLGFGRWAPGGYLAAQAAAIVLPGSLLGSLAALTVGRAILQRIAGFGLTTAIDLTGVLQTAGLSLAIVLAGVAAPWLWLQRSQLAELLRAE
jgi:ABC-type antimicrobial peptide transport system permease subunit